MNLRDWLMLRNSAIVAVLLAFFIGVDVGEAAVKGDLNDDGTITIADAILSLRISIGIVPMTSAAQAIGDLNNDGLITLEDALKTLRIAIGVEPAIPTTRRISGTVALSGKGLEGVILTLNDSKTATTDARGNYSFEGLSNGSYIINPSKSKFLFTPINITQTVSEADVNEVNFSANPLPTFSISGRVTSSGTGFKEVIMTLSGDASGSVSTDANGNYSFVGLCNGKYTITPFKTAYMFKQINSDQIVNNDNIFAVNFDTITLPLTPATSTTIDLPVIIRAVPDDSDDANILL